MRIVSLVPAATHWLEAFGADHLVTSRPTTTPPAELVDERFDFVIVEDEHWLTGWPRTLHLPPPAAVEFRPQTLKQTLDAVLELARRVGVLPQAMEFIAAGEWRLQRLRAHMGVDREGRIMGKEGPSVLVADRLEPLTEAGRWVPDLLRLVGARGIRARSGEPAVALSDPSGVDVDACVILGDFPLEPVHDLAKRVRAQRVAILDRNLVAEAGPRLYRAAELLALAAHGEESGVGAEDDEMIVWESATAP